MITLLIILLHIIPSVMAYSIMDNVYYNEFGERNLFMLIPSLGGVLSLVVSLVLLTSFYYNEKDLPKEIRSSNIWIDRLGDKNTKLSKSQFREIRMFKILNPKKFKLYQLKFTLFPSSVKKFIKKL